MDRDYKISVLVWDWMESVDMDTLHEYAADQMTKHYESLSDDELNEAYEEIENG